MGRAIGINSGRNRKAFPGLVYRQIKRTRHDGSRHWTRGVRSAPKEQIDNGRLDKAKWAIVAVLWLITILSLVGCGATRTIYIPNGKAVRIAEDTIIKVWVKGANGTEVAGEMNIPAGWFAMPDPAETGGDNGP